MPLVGVAASVALAFGVSFVMHNGSGMATGTNTEIATLTTSPAQSIDENYMQNSTNDPEISRSQNTTAKHRNKKDVKQAEDHSSWFSLRMDNTTNSKSTAHANRSMAAYKSLMNEDQPVNKKKKSVVATPGYYTFNDEPQNAKTPKVAINISGGVNYGSQTSGYTVGASARRMINDKVFIEGDIAFTGSNNTQKTLYLEKVSSASNTIPSGLMRGGSVAKNSSGSSSGNTPDQEGILKTEDQQYTLYYAQVTPSIGYKIVKKLSVAAGPDFQQMVVDNRPAQSTVDPGNLQVAPVFDIGLMGKTEYAVTKNLKAAVYYREGINNIITPMNKYIDRNYIQFQVKCAIFNK